MSDLHHARGFQELLNAPDDGGPYVHTSIFSARTWGERRLSRRKLTLLRRLDGALREILQEGERVYFVTRGSMVSFWESYFLGWVVYYLKRRAFVLTNRRILLLQITSRDHPGELRAEIDYRAVTRVDSTMLGNLRLRFRNGAKRVVSYVPKPDRKFLRDRIRDLQKVLRDASPAHDEIRDLCPHCFAPAEVGARACATCRRPFKSAGHAGLLSLVFPGAGDLYLGHGAFAVLEMLGAAVFWLVLAVLAFDPATGPLEFAVVVAFVLIGVHGIDAVSTRYVGRIGVYPAAGRGGAARRFLTAAVVPVAVLVASAVPLSKKVGLTPADGVVAGEALPARHLAALRAAGYLDPQETLVRFFSPGTVSILESGALLTDRRVVTYGRIGDERYVAEAPYERIVDVAREVTPGSRRMSAVAVVQEDEPGFWFTLPAAEGQDVAFEQEFVARWREARVRRGEGVWYEGGAGGSAEDAIAVRGLAPGADATDAERQWLTLWLGTEGQDWELESRFHAPETLARVERLVVRESGGERLTFFFDVSGGR